jgi:hypothetical protein
VPSRRPRRATVGRNVPFCALMRRTVISARRMPNEQRLHRPGRGPIGTLHARSALPDGPAECGFRMWSRRPVAHTHPATGRLRAITLPATLATPAIGNLSAPLWLPGRLPEKASIVSNLFFCRRGRSLGILALLTLVAIRHRMICGSLHGQGSIVEMCSSVFDEMLDRLRLMVGYDFNVNGSEPAMATLTAGLGATKPPAHRFAASQN